MKSSKASGLHKFLSVILIAVLLIFLVGFASNGWQEDLFGPDNGEVGDKTDNTDENKDGPGNETNSNTNDDGEGNDNNNTSEDGSGEMPPEDDDPITVPPVYISAITGLPVSEAQKNAVPYGFLVNPSLPLYGISSSELAIEFPTEDGATRMLSYTTDKSNLWKIGSFVETRAFISAMSHFFGGIIVSYGCDDVIPYSTWDLSGVELDLSKHPGSTYKENGKYVYTSFEKLGYAEEGAINLNAAPYKTAPFDFATEAVLGVSKATNITIPFSEKSKTEFFYSEKTERYLFYKSGERKVDMLSGKNIGYDNVFVLLADATTYEKASGTELVIDVTAGGRGYYATHGTLTEITWGLDLEGNLNFYSLSGERLTANPGNSYISYYKASESANIKIS